MSVSCKVCDTLPPGDLIELDMLLGDPMRWPVTIWGAFAPPEGGLPASYRRLGAIKMGLAWLDEHGWSGEFTKAQVRRHWTYDVPALSVDVDAMVARGLVAEGQRGGLTTDVIDPLSFVRLYSKGIELGIRGLELLNLRAQALIDQKEEVPLVLVKMMIDAGTKLAMSQASIKAAGKPFGDADVDENAAFAGSGEVGQRLGHSRIRVVDGERRPVVDEGKADRDHYNERAAQEGGVRIGGR